MKTTLGRNLFITLILSCSAPMMMKGEGHSPPENLPECKLKVKSIKGIYNGTLFQGGRYTGDHFNQDCLNFNTLCRSKEMLYSCILLMEKPNFQKSSKKQINIDKKNYWGNISVDFTNICRRSKLYTLCAGDRTSTGTG